MNWEETRDLLSELGETLGETVYLVQGDDLDTIALNVPTVAWFLSMKCSRTLSIGIYDGDGHALVGMEEIPLAELTPGYVRERVERAAVEPLRRALDPDALREIFGPPEKAAWRDIDPDTL